MENIQKIMQNQVSFLANSEIDDIAISSRIRLARNLKEFSFPTGASIADLNSVRNLVANAIKELGTLGKDDISFIPEDMSDLDKEILFERRLVSRDFLNRPLGTGLYCSADEHIGIMVNEEDHLRMQILLPGNKLDQAWSQINKLDDNLSKKLNFAFDEKLGYLTSCPTNIGTGLRASVMLHLPGLVLSGQINTVVQGINKLNLAVRGIFGEGTENLGNFYQVSNQSTLGENEGQIIERLKSVIQKIIDHEIHTRQMMLEKDKYTLMDYVGRSYGTLRHAYKIDSKETFNSLSAVRLGVNLNLFQKLSIATINKILVNIKPAHLQKSSMRKLDKAERDIQRAALVREKLKQSE